MEEKFYLSKRYKYQIIIVSVGMLYPFLASLYYGRFYFFYLILIIIFLGGYLYNWRKPWVVITDSEVSFRIFFYKEKRILLKDIRSIKIDGKDNRYLKVIVMYNQGGKIKKHVLRPTFIKNHLRMIEILKSKIENLTPGVE